MDPPGQKKTQGIRRAIRGWLPRWMMILAVGGFLCLVYPISFPSWLAQSDLEIFTTASQNPSASGAELRLLSITRSDGKSIDLSTLKSSNLWKLDRGQRLSANKNPFSKLSLEEKNAFGYQLKFLSGPQAGIVNVVWSGQEHRLDLYNLVEKNVEITLPQNRKLQAFQRLYQFSWALLVGLGLFALTNFLVSQRWERLPRSQPPNRWTIFGYALPPFGVWTIYLLAFWPGIMSYDSLLQWREMTTGQYTEISPTFHTFTNWLLTRLWPSPAAIALFQILSLSLVVGWALYLFRKAGVPKWACALSDALISLSPVCAATSITLWKDNPYTTAMLVFSLLLFQLSVTEGRWLEKPAVWIALGFFGALAALFRHNGLPAVIGTFVVLPLLYPKFWRSALFAALSFMAVFFLVRGPLYRQLGVDQSFRDWLYGIRLLHYLAAYSQPSAAVPPEQLAVLHRLWPGNDPLPYDCHFIDTTHFTIPPRLIIDQLPALEQTLFPLVQKEPRVALDHWLCVSDLIWRISEPPHSLLSTYDFSNFWNQVDYDVGVGIATIPIHSQLPRLQPILSHLLFTTNTWLIWRPALYLYLALYCGLVFALRHCNPSLQSPQNHLPSQRAPIAANQSPVPSSLSESTLRGNLPSPAQRSIPFRRCVVTSLSFYTPLVIHTLVLLAINSSQEARFQFFAYVFCLLSISLIFIPHPSPILVPQPTDTTARIPQ